MKILIVCSGNTCRSPMAGGLLMMLASSRGLIVEVQTAGLAHHSGRRVAERAVIVMKELEIDISGECSKPVTEADLGWADLIVTVQDDHADYLVEKFQVMDSKIRRLKPNVQDPYCGPIEKYRETRNELSGHLLRLIDSLQESAS